jgi:2-methylcitrate dehydratase PrpD
MRQDISFIEERLIEFVTRPPVLDGALDAAQRGLLDWTGTALAGSREPAGRIARELIGAGEPHGTSTIIGASGRAGAVDAAFANGVAGHALDFDDTHLMSAVHATATVLPAALSTAESRGATTREALAGYIVGFEVATFLGQLLYPVHHEAAWHATAVFGTVGAAAASATVLGLDGSSAASALALGATQAAGVRAMFGTMAKPFHAGRAASSGVLAAQLASRGFEAPARPFTGRQGYFAHLGATEPEHFAETPLPGDVDLRIADNDFKLHACCHATHAAVDAALAIRTEHAVALDDVERVTIYCNRAVPTVAGRPDPQTGLAAKFSVAYAVLTALATGDAGLDRFTDAAVSGSSVRRALDRVRLEVVPDFSIREARLEVDVRDGRSLSATTTAPRGSAPNPASWDDLARKFRSLATGVVGTDRAGRIERLATDPDASAAGFLALLATT